MGIKRRGGSVAPARPRPAPAPARPSAAPARSSAPAPVPHAQQSAGMSSHANARNLPAQQQHHPQQQQPMMQHPQQQPMMGQPQQPGLMGSIGSGIMSGMTFGVGSSIAHRAVDSMMGPRTMTVEHTGMDQQQVQPQQQPSPAAMAGLEQQQQQPSMVQQQHQQHQQQPAASDQQQQKNSDQGRCAPQLDFFNRCMQMNSYNLDACQQYTTALQQCQRGSF